VVTRDRAAEASALCVSCGFCCDGTLFASVRLEDGEAARLASFSLPIVVRDDLTEAMPQPCRALEATLCTAYDVRPVTCRRYRCHLLTALDEGEVDLDEARGVVSTVREALAPLRSRLPEGFSAGRRAALPTKWRKGSAPPDHAFASAIERVDGLLDEHFRGRFRGV